MDPRRTEPSDIDLEETLALHGGPRAVQSDQADMFSWPIVTPEHQEAVLKVLNAGNMSGLDITKQFEREYADYYGRKYALGCVNGTAAILEAMYGLGVGVGDEVIAPSITYWASIVQAYTLGATPVFADVDPDTVCIDPTEIERLITPRTKAIVIVHYGGMPADMDRIMAIASKHNVKVLEDCSHAHGALYKGRQIGTFGDAAAFSIMSGKAFAVGEGGIYITDDRRVFERGLLFGHYIRRNEITLEDLKPFVGLPCGGVKNRLNQLSSALGLVQLRLYPDQMSEITKAMTYFCDLLEGQPGLRAIRPTKESGSTKGGWYYPLFRYLRDEIGGLSLTCFAKAVNAEGAICKPGVTAPLHRHPLFTGMDVYGHGKPTRIANLSGSVDIEHYCKTLPVSESINSKVFGVPWFKHFRPNVIEEYARAYKKVIANHKALLAEDNGDDTTISRYSTYFTEAKDKK